MDNETTTSETTNKTPLNRKALILGGAALGIIIAGGYAIFKKGALTDESVEIVTNEDGSVTVRETNPEN